MPTESKFIHRQSTKGAWDSICMACFLTVVSGANVRSELELQETESNHVCDISNGDTETKNRETK